jgi:hypothetical protein
MGYARFTGTCVCGETLEPAFHPERKFVFWNCFRCFPVFPRASKKQSKWFIRQTRRISHLRDKCASSRLKVYGGDSLGANSFLNLSPSGRLKPDL